MSEKAFSMQVKTSFGPLALDVVQTLRCSFQLSVEPGGKVVLRAPQGAREERLEDIVRRKAAWIMATRERLSSVIGVDYGDGSTFHVLGEARKLRINITAKPSIFFLETEEGWRLDLPFGTTPEKGEQEARKALGLWSDRKALDYLSERVLFWSDRMGLRLPVINVRRQRRRWGSCNTRRRSIQFNRALIAFPAVIIDYVVVHELCHLAFPDHSRAFWAEVSRWCPVWKEHHLWLKRQAHKYRAC